MFETFKIESGVGAGMYARGDAELLKHATVAVAGARASTAYGSHVAALVAEAAVKAGRTVIAGGAYGIESTAVRSALAAGGRVIAVIAGGLDRLYPAGNAEMFAWVLESGGLILSASADGTPPSRERFIQRSSEIARLADAVVVVEAGSRSGALVVAREAIALGTVVAAVPGPVTSAASAGSNALLGEPGVRTLAHPTDLTGIIGDALEVAR